MSQDKDFSTIFQRLFNQLPRYVHQPPWQDLPAPTEIRRSPADPAAVMADLLKAHTQAELVEASVLIIDENNEVQLNPALCQADSAIIALRESKQRAPFDLLAGGSTLTGRSLPVCACLRDRRIHGMMREPKENVLCVSSSPADVALLLSMNFPATFDTGLAQLGGVYLEQVRQDYKLDPLKPKPYTGIIEEDGNEGQKDIPPDILCLGVSLANLSAEPPPGLPVIAAHLAAMEQHLGLRMDRFCCWQATEQDLERIGFCRSYGKLKDLKDAIAKSIRESSGQLIAPPQKPDDSPQDLAAAIQALERLRLRPRRDSEAEHGAWAKIHALIREGSIGPLFEAMETTEDPIERSYWLMAAMNGRMLYPQCARLMLRMVGDINGSAKVKPYPDAEFRQMMQATDRQRQIFRDIIDYRKDPFRGWK